MRNCEEFGKKYQGGKFVISFSRLTLLNGSPQHVTGDFSCFGNQLTSLVGGPQIVDAGYDCRSNSLTDLVGCASHIGGKLYFEGNPLTSLVGIHKIIKSCNEIWFTGNKVTQGGIGLLLIENLTIIATDTIPFQIISTYLGSGTKGMMECRKELLSRGYDQYAKL